jgi:hypothetical protein
VCRQPLSGRLVVGCAHERVNPSIAALDETAEQLHPHETRGAGQKHSAHHLGLSAQRPDET